MRLTEKIWTGNSATDAMARVALAPLEAMYSAGMSVRSVMYDRGILATHPSPIAVVSVGNITVGGTGKTPVASWIANKLASIGMKPAIVLRGYGDDEPLVHERLNPGLAVIVDSDRVSGIARARAGGADAAILDDAFQHRRAARDVDLVLVSADDWTGKVHSLPRGPYREPLSALSRASAIIITRKAASDDVVDSVEKTLAHVASETPVAVMRLELGELVSVSAPVQHLALEAIRGKRVLAIAGVGNTEAFFRQLENAGAMVNRRSFPDHHRFSQADALELGTAASVTDYVVCTLKDAVKLGPLWAPDKGPLWYVSLAVKVERGEAALDTLLMRLRGRIAVK